MSKTSQHELHRTITKLIHNEFPGCEPEFVGSVELAGPRTRQFGFKLIGPGGAPRTGVIWLDPSFYSGPSSAWLRRVVQDASNRIER